MTLAHIGGTPLTRSGSIARIGLRWSEVVAHTHAGSAAVSEFYTPSAGEQSEYGISSTRRVSTGFDIIGHKHLTRDNGTYAPLYGGTLPLPGPQYISASRRFNGLPAWKFDKLPNGTQYAMLSPNATPFATGDYFNPPNGYAVPWGIAMLVRLLAVSGSANAPWDSILGGSAASATVNPGTQIGGAGPWSVSNWTSGTVGATITSGTTPTADMTSLIIVNTRTGAGNSGLTAVYKNAAALHVLDPVLGTLDENPLKEFFLGWHHQFYMAAWGVKSGGYTSQDVVDLWNWSRQWCPPEAAIASEP